ncbi:MAG: hypothetical protein ACE5JX_08560 [Acidobacteriota bacterium]
MSHAVDALGPSSARSGHWLATGWDWFTENPGTCILIGLVAVVFLGVTNLLLWGPVLAGLALVGLRRARLERIELSDFFDGFGFFLPSFLSGLLVLIFVLLGLVFLIVPGIVIFSMYLFTFHFIVDQNQDFWEAMESSRKLVSRDYFGFTLFAILILGINLLGLAFLGVGCILTVVVTSLATTVAYLECTGAMAEPGQAKASQPIRID